MPVTRRRSVSPKQLAANRANAARSTGPRSPAGKARSAQNARKHGFTGSSFSVVRLEDLQAVARLRADLIAVYRPVNSQELFALERMALAQQSILRAARLESGLFTTCLNEALDPNNQPVIAMSPEMAGDGDIEITRAQNRNYALANGFLRQVACAPSWSLALRYQAQAERHYRRAVEEFDRLVRQRANLPNEPISEADLIVNESTYTKEGEPVWPPKNEPDPSAGPFEYPLHISSCPPGPPLEPPEPRDRPLPSAVSPAPPAGGPPPPCSPPTSAPKRSRTRPPHRAGKGRKKASKSLAAPADIAHLVTRPTQPDMAQAATPATSAATWREEVKSGSTATRARVAALATRPGVAEAEQPPAVPSPPQYGSQLTRHCAVAAT